MMRYTNPLTDIDIDTTYTSHNILQWRSKVGEGPRARIPKWPLFPTQGSSAPPPQRWARVHCTPCTPYWYATSILGNSSLRHNVYLAVTSSLRPGEIRNHVVMWRLHANEAIILVAFRCSTTQCSCVDRLAGRQHRLRSGVHRSGCGVKLNTRAFN